MNRDKKVVVVTGCSRGLGRAMVDGFSARGDQVAGCARNAESIDQLSDQIEGGPHLFHVADVSSSSEVGAFCELVLERLGATSA